MKTVQELMNLTGRVALVTGGAGHIGQALCESLAELGAAVVVLDKNTESCDVVAERLRETTGADVMALPTDLADEDELGQVCNTVLTRFHRLDILVNCAAYVAASNLEGWITDFAHQSPQQWRAALDLNLIVPFALTQSCAEALSRSGTGSVVNISSIYGMAGADMRLYEGTSMGNSAGYAVSKGGLLQLTRWLATVMAPRVRVNSITPGGISRGQPDTFCQRYAARTPLARMGTEEELKGAIAYLGSDLSAYVTGHNLVVDGGWTAW